MDRLELLRALLDSSKAVIFDFDNVVVDSEPFHYRAYSEVFGARGHTIDQDDYWLEWTSKGGGAEKEIKRYRLGFDPLDIRAEKDPVYSAFCESGEIPVFPYAMKVIRSLSASGLTLAIASGSYERDIRALLKYNGIEGLFAAVVGKDAVELTKPHPETYRRAVGALGLAPPDCFAIEDAEKGVIAAHAAGIKVITVETRVTRGFDLGDPDIAFSGLDELYSMMIAAGLKPSG